MSLIQDMDGFMESIVETAIGLDKSVGDIQMGITGYALSVSLCLVIVGQAKTIHTLEKKIIGSINCIETYWC